MGKRSRADRRASATGAAVEAEGEKQSRTAATGALADDALFFVDEQGA